MTAMAVIAAILLLAALLGLAALCPWHRPRRCLAPRYAHRGLWGGDRAENSLEAFRAAVRAGYAIELDVQLSADGEVMVFHDSTLLRACGRDVRLDSLTAQQLSELEIFGTRCTVPTLDALLEAVDGRVPLLVELKTGAGGALLCRKTAERLARYRGEAAVESFDPRLLLWFGRHAPHIPRGQLSMNFLAHRGPLPRTLAPLLWSMATNFLTRPDFIAYRLEDERALPLRLCRGLFRLGTAAWTVTSPEEQARAQERFDSVIFEGYLP